MEKNIVSDYYSLKPQHFPIVDTIEIKQVSSSGPEALMTTVYIVLYTRDRLRSLHLFFEKVSGLLFKQPLTSSFQLFLDIRENSQLSESEKFRIIDNEDNAIQFYAGHFFAEVVE